MFFWIYLLIFTIICYLSFYTKQSIAYRERYNTYKCNAKIVFLFGIVLIVLSGMRSGIGDTGYYMYGFNEYKEYSVRDLSEILNQKEPGYKLIIILISMFTQSEQIFLLIAATITIGLILKRIYESSEDIGLSLFLFYTTGIFLGTMNGLRQYLVVAVLFFMTDKIIKNKPIEYIIAILVLSTIHTSALFMIPIFFVARRKVWKLDTFLFFIILLLALSNVSVFMGNIADTLSGTVYGNYSESLMYETEAGANIFRVMVMLVPVGVSFLSRKYVDTNDMEYRVYSNMIILNAVFYILAAYNWIFARIAMYLQIYILLFYPYILKRVFNKQSKRLIMVFLIIFYSVFIMYEVRNTNYMSYYLEINQDLIGPVTRQFY